MSESGARACSEPVLSRVEGQSRRACPERSRRACPEQSRRVIVFTCNWNAYSGLEMAGYERLSLPAGIRPVRVMCLGRLHPGLVLKAFELGADGVLMVGCPPGECRYEFGNSRAEELFEETRALARLLGIGEERLRLDWVAAGDGEVFVEKVQEFVEGMTGNE